MNAPRVRFQGSVSFDQEPLFSDLDFAIPAGQWTGLLGPSGIGKSTLLRLLAGLPCAGEFAGKISFDDRAALSGATIVPVAYMAQSDSLAPWLNVQENIVLGSRLRGESPDMERANQLLERVGLSEHALKRPAALSGGMRQRAALARTLMEQCPVVLLDEPFCALDARTRADMQDLAFELLNDATVLLATHDPGEAVRLTHQMTVLFRDGLHPQPVLPTVPLRPHDDPRVLRAQAALLSVLRQPSC